MRLFYFSSLKHCQVVQPSRVLPLLPPLPQKVRIRRTDSSWHNFLDCLGLSSQHKDCPLPAAAALLCTYESCVTMEHCLVSAAWVWKHTQWSVGVNTGQQIHMISHQIDKSSGMRNPTCKLQDTEKTPSKGCEKCAFLLKWQPQTQNIISRVARVDCWFVRLNLFQHVSKVVAI